VDLLIRNARIYDGSGSPWFPASIGVEGGRVRVLRGDTSPVQAHRIIEADGLAVSPGFIDMHAHSTMAMLGEPHHDAKVRQGVTTDLLGVDGNSYAPFLRSEDLEHWAVFNAGLDGEKPQGLTWSSVDEYLDAYDRKVAINVAYVVGNSPLRISTVGWNDRPPAESEMSEMRRLLRRAMEEGAFGMSTGLTYPPGSYASSDELAELCSVVERLGGIHVSHVRYTLGDGFRDPFIEMLELSRRTGVPLHISHYASTWRRNGQFRPLLAMVDEAREEGLSVTFDAYPYNYGGSRATVALPEWVQEGGPEPLLERLADPAERARMREEDDPRQARWRKAKGWHLTGFREPGNRRFEGLNLHEIAERLDKDPLDTLCDLLLEERLRLSYVGHDSNNHVTVRKLLAHPACMVGSDGLLVGEYPSPRTYGTFPKMLGDLVREEALMSLEEAIRKMTWFPAQALGLSDRGIVKEGAAADLVVFDPATVRSDATLDRPAVFPEGIPYVIVNGVLVIDEGRHTGATPGRALRRSG
jgi:N-acyl-D-amino-acid deacylase